MHGAIQTQHLIQLEKMREVEPFFGSHDRHRLLNAYKTRLGFYSLVTLLGDLDFDRVIFVPLFRVSSWLVCIAHHS